jgi:hypothetical protein
VHIDSRGVNRQAPKRNLLRDPRHVTEFEVQAFLYSELKAIGWTVRGEVPTFRHKARFDLVVYDNEGYPLRIIETKCVRRSAKRGTRSGDQIGEYYDFYGVPVDLVCGMKEAARYIGMVRAGQILPPF